MERVTVTVPDGLKSGEEFTVSFNGTDYTTEVPGGVQGGEDIDVELPAAPKSNKSQSVVVTVPGGVGSGMPFTVEFNGQEFDVILPEGLGVGDELEVELPASTQQPPPPQPQPAIKAVKAQPAVKAVKVQPAVKPAAVEQHKSALHSRIRAFLDASLNARGTDAIAQNEEAARKIITNEIPPEDKSRFVNTLPPGRWSKMSWVERLEFLEPTLPTQEQLDAREAAAASRRKAEAAERAAQQKAAAAERAFYAPFRTGIGSKEPAPSFDPRESYEYNKDYYEWLAKSGEAPSGEALRVLLRATVDFSATSREGGTGGPEYTQTVKVTPARGQEAGALKQTVQMSAGEFRSRHLTRVDKALARNAACKNWLDQQLAATTAPLTCTVHSPGRQSRQMGYVDETVVTTVLANHTVELKVREAFDFYSMK